MSATEQVWVIEISSPRDDFKSYMVGPDGPDDFLWIEDPTDAAHFLSQTEAEVVADSMGSCTATRRWCPMRGRRAPQFELPLFLANAA
jgi:hypothetical protein